MNPKYDTELRVRDMQEDNIELVQNQSEVEQFNNEYKEDYSYYFIKFVNDCASELFGSDSIFLHSNVYFVANL